MRFIGTIIEKLQRHPKRIVFPEGTEARVLQAARQFQALRLGAPVLLGDRTKVKEMAADLNISLEGIRVINPAESEELETPDVVTAPFACSRLRKSEYEAAQLDEIANSLRRRSAEGDVFAYFKHEEEPTGAICAVDTLRRLQHL